MRAFPAPTAILILITGLLAAAGSAAAAVIEIVYTDPAGFGFRDTRRVDPVADNPAITLGAQRRAVMQKAVDIWASRLDSAIAIRVNASFDDLGCGDETTLGLGGSWGIARDFPEAPMNDIHYSISLATALRGERFAQVDQEMRVTFNFRIDSGNCIGGVDGFWYGVSPTVPAALGTFSFLELALHELGHGLGMQSWTDRQTREFLGSPARPDITSTMLFDIGLQRTWAEMTAAQRRSSAVSGSNLAWTGAQTNQRAAERLLPPGRVQVSPAINGSSQFPAWIQGFPPFLPLEGLTAELVLADGPGNAADPWGRALACQALTNRDQVAGRIVLVKRGECTFAMKWQQVFNAGGVGILLVDNQPPGSSGAIERDRGISVDRHLAIPIWLVGRNTGNQLRSALPGLELTLTYDLDAPARGTRQGLVNMQASPQTEDSNVVHFADTMFPSSVMNPSITNIAYSGDLDFVPEFMFDLGWPSNAAKLGQYSGNWYNPSRAGEGCQLTMEQGPNIPVLTCYLYRDGEQFWLIGNGIYLGDRYEFREMIVTKGTGYGRDFNPAKVERIVWGDIIMRLQDCNNARFELRPDGEQQLPPFTTQMTRIVAGNCNLRASQQISRVLTGNYFAPGRSGEGIQLAREANGSAWVVTWYTYSEGHQVWVIGSGEMIDNRIEFGDAVITRGGDWGSDFRASRIERIPFGTITLQFQGCNDVLVTKDTTLPDFESSQRLMTRIIPRQCE